MRVLARLSLLLFFACVALPAWAADAPFPAPIEAAFADAKNAMMDDPTQVFGPVAKAEKLANGLTDPRQKAMALATARWLAGEAHLRNDDARAAGPLLADGLRLIKPITEPIKLRGDLLMSQGTYYMQTDQAGAALRNYVDAANVFEAAAEPRSQAIAFQNIALLYTAANDNTNALGYFARAAKFTGDPMLSLSLYNNRGAVFLVLERYNEAEAEFQKALTIARDRNNTSLQARILGNIARSQVEARKLDEAEHTLAQGFALAKGADAQGFRQQLLATAARVAMERQDWAKARMLIVEAFKGVAPTKTSIAFREAHRFAYMIFSHTSELALALEHLEALKRLNDESAKVATDTSNAILAAKFKSADQQSQISNLEADQARKAAEFQRTIFVGLGSATIVIITLLSIALFVIRRSRNQVRSANIVLGETNVALEKALKAKTEFLATTSHEIRTPLNGILGMTQVMLSDPRLAADMRDRIGIVHGAGMTMRSLVDDILDVAKIETGNLTVDAAPMDLCAVLKDVTRIWEEQARAKGLTFKLELEAAPRWIVSDAGRLRQIVFNLLSNAIKFTEKGSVGVRVFTEGEGDAKRLRLAIHDSGIGIPADKRDEIFESFKQADSGTTRKFGGTGLGLTICRNLGVALGGDVTVDSVEGEGSVFTLDLPLVLAEAPEEEAKAATGGTMLVLDRNPIARSMLKTLLEPHVGALKFLANADEAQAALADGATQLVIDEMTLKAGGEDPFALLADLVVAAEGAGAKTAILWAKPDEAIRKQLHESGVSQVLEKPLNGAALIEKLVSHAEENSPSGGTPPLVSRAA